MSPSRLGRRVRVSVWGLRHVTGSSSSHLRYAFASLDWVERDKILNEYRELIEQIIDLLDILNNDERLILVIKKSLGLERRLQ